MSPRDELRIMRATIARQDRRRLDPRLDATDHAILDLIDRKTLLRKGARQLTIRAIAGGVQRCARTVRYHLAKLERLGVLKRLRRQGKHGGDLASVFSLMSGRGGVQPVAPPMRARAELSFGESEGVAIRGGRRRRLEAASSAVSAVLQALEPPTPSGRWRQPDGAAHEAAAQAAREQEWERKARAVPGESVEERYIREANERVARWKRGDMRWTAAVAV